MHTQNKYQFRLEKRSGDFSLEPEDVDTILKRILIGEDHEIELRIFSDGDEIEARHKEDWKDWREFEEIVSKFHEIKNSTKYRFISKTLQGNIAIEEIRLLEEFLNHSMIFAPQTNSWERLEDFWSIEQSSQNNEIYQKESQSDDVANLSGQFLVPNESLLRLDQVIRLIVGSPQDFAIGERFFRSFFDVLLTYLKNNERIHFPKLGTFHLAQKQSYTRFFIQRKDKDFYKNFWNWDYTKPVIKINPTVHEVVYPARHMLCFRPAQNLKNLLKHDGYEESIQHQIFTGEDQASKNALVWSQQKGKLSVRRKFVQQIATDTQLPIPQVAALLNRWVNVLGRCLAQDNVIETDEFGSIFTEWYREHTRKGFDGLQRTIPRHRRAYFVLSSALLEKHGLIETEET